MDLMEALSLVVGSGRVLESQEVPLESALGRVASRDVAADRDLPGEDRSQYDGYALRSTDTVAAGADHPVLLRSLPFVLAAGQVATMGLNRGECLRIFTGASLPAGADVVVPQEQVTVRGGMVELRRFCRAGEGVVHKGADAPGGEMLLEKGSILNPTRLAVLAALGRTHVSVSRRPRVALLATGDEVSELGQTWSGPGTYCNNRWLLGWLTEIMGGEPLHLGVAPDDPANIVERLEDAGADIVITTGGMGKGGKDFMLEAWRRLGVKILFRRLNLSPGRHAAFGTRGAQACFAFPGNPWAAQLLFQELVVPLLKKCLGAEDLGLPMLSAKAERGLNNPGGGYRAVRGRLRAAAEGWVFQPLLKDGTSLLKSMGDSFAYTLLNPPVVEVTAGSWIQVRLHDVPLIAHPVLRRS